MRVRKKQCKACPWKVSTVPGEDIPGGYCRKLHEGLRSTLAEPGSLYGSGKMMACHESDPEDQYPCVGWVHQQLGPGNNLPLRLLALDGRFSDLEIIGEQHDSFEDTLT